MIDLGSIVRNFDYKNAQVKFDYDEGKIEYLLGDERLIQYSDKRYSYINGKVIAHGCVDFEIETLPDSLEDILKKEKEKKRKAHLVSFIVLTLTTLLFITALVIGGTL